MNGAPLLDFLKLLFEAPITSVLAISGILFLLLGIVPIDKISIKGLSAGKITQQWRVVSAIAGACLIIGGVALTLISEPVDGNGGNTPAASCPGAPPQRVQVGEQARVCTAKDKVLLRESPSKAAKSIEKFSPGTLFTVLDGPVCADDWSWWQIETDEGVTGWIAEGGDEKDTYFICPYP